MQRTCGIFPAHKFSVQVQGVILYLPTAHSRKYTSQVQTALRTFAEARKYPGNPYLGILCPLCPSSRNWAVSSAECLRNSPFCCSNLSGRTEQWSCTAQSRQCQAFWVHAGSHWSPLWSGVDGIELRLITHCDATPACHRQSKRKRHCRRKMSADLPFPSSRAVQRHGICVLINDAAPSI